MAVRVVLVLAALVCLAAPARAGERWKPIEPAHLALEKSGIEPGADAEALFWEVHVEDVASGGSLSTVLNHYLRVKVFNERGVASQSTVSIPYASGTRISDVRGRTIKPDGTIVPLEPDAVFDRVTVKASGVKIRNKSFAMPAVEPGAILEYRYRERRADAAAHYLRLYFQRDIPVQSVTYHIKPYEAPGWVMRSRTFHGYASPFTPTPDAFYRTTATRLRSFREEPYMPPDAQVRMWMLVYYSRAGEPDPKEFWKDYANSIHRASRSRMKVTSGIERAAKEAVGEATEPAEKLRRIYDWCRTKIRNRHDEATGMTEEERDKLKANKHPADALKSGVGTGFDINMMFAALCTAAGFEARIALLSDRSDLFFDPTFPDGYFLRTYSVAVKLGDGWKLFDPGTPSVPFGHLRWQEEGVKALVCGPDEPVWVETPMSGPEDSQVRRSGTFTLDAEGNLEGDVRIEHRGHGAARRRDDWLDEAPATREQSLRDDVVASMSTAQASAVEFEHGTDHGQPFAYRYHVRVPGYAPKTGQRLLLQPAYFQRGSKPSFPASERLHPVYFSYPWSSLDSVRIDLPAGWELEGGDSPAPARAEGVSRYEATVGLTGDGRHLVWTRAFEFGSGGAVYFPRDQYAGVKHLFDAVAARDEHAVTLRAAPAATR